LQAKYPLGSKNVATSWEKISGKASFDATPYKHTTPVKKAEEKPSS